MDVQLQAIQFLSETVVDLNLLNGLKNSLTSKLNGVLASLEIGQDDTAMNQLQAFINEVYAQSGKEISGDDAADLVAAAEALVATIES
jgi:hypothetical protein